MDTRFLRLLSGLACFAALIGRSIFPAAAQEGPKLYVFTSGSLGGFPKAALQIGGTGNIDWAPVSFYVIKHPKGNVMFDTRQQRQDHRRCRRLVGTARQGLRPEDDQGRRHSRPARARSA